MNTIAIVACYVISVIALAFFCKEKKTKEEPIIDYETLMFILNSTIENELSLRLKLEYELKKYIGIPDYKGETAFLVKKIMNSLSPNLIHELELFYNRRYVMAYVTQKVQIFLNEYIRQSKLSTM